MKFSRRAERIEPFYVMEVAKAAQAMAREVAGSSQPMIFLNIGEPDFTAPPLVQEAAARAAKAQREKEEKERKERERKERELREKEEKKKKKKEGPSWFEKTFNKLSNEIFSDDDMK